MFLFTTCWKKRGPHANCKTPLKIFGVTCCSYRLYLAVLISTRCYIHWIWQKQSEKLISVLKAFYTTPKTRDRESSQVKWLLPGKQGPVQIRQFLQKAKGNTSNYGLFGCLDFRSYLMCFRL